MAIQRSKQDWSNGSIVRVGFMELRVLGVQSITLTDDAGVQAVYDGLPDIYTLESLDGERTYEFVPHNGLNRIN